MKKKKCKWKGIQHRKYISKKMNKISFVAHFVFKILSIRISINLILLVNMPFADASHFCAFWLFVCNFFFFILIFDYQFIWLSDLNFFLTALHSSIKAVKRMQFLFCIHLCEFVLFNLGRTLYNSFVFARMNECFN